MYLESVKVYEWHFLHESTVMHTSKYNGVFIRWSLTSAFSNTYTKWLCLWLSRGEPGGQICANENKFPFSLYTELTGKMVFKEKITSTLTFRKTLTWFLWQYERTGILFATLMFNIFFFLNKGNSCVLAFSWGYKTKSLHIKSLRNPEDRVRRLTLDVDNKRLVSSVV